jgi:hypothetical protein
MSSAWLGTRHVDCVQFQAQATQQGVVLTTLTMVAAHPTPRPHPPPARRRGAVRAAASHRPSLLPRCAKRGRAVFEWYNAAARYH